MKIAFIECSLRWLHPTDAFYGCILQYYIASYDCVLPLHLFCDCILRLHFTIASCNCILRLHLAIASCNCIHFATAACDGCTLRWLHPTMVASCDCIIQLLLFCDRILQPHLFRDSILRWLHRAMIASYLGHTWYDVHILRLHLTIASYDYIFYDQRVLRLHHMILHDGD